MTRIIAHRARIDYPLTKDIKQNEYYEYDKIEATYLLLNNGFDVEVDVRYDDWNTSFKDRWCCHIGHDRNEKGFQDYLNEFDSFVYDDRIYYHVKNIKALNQFIDNSFEGQYFIQNNDEYSPVLNSHGLIWVNLSTPELYKAFKSTNSMYTDTSMKVLAKSVAVINDQLFTDHNDIKFLNKFHSVCVDKPYYYKTMFNLHG